MVKSELIDRISKRINSLPSKVVSMSINEIIEKITNNLCSGERIEIRGFGSFCLHHRQSRKARNPMTGETVATIEKFMPHFKPGKELRDKINACFGKPINDNNDSDDD